MQAARCLLVILAGVCVGRPSENLLPCGRGSEGPRVHRLEACATPLSQWERGTGEAVRWRVPDSCAASACHGGSEPGPRGAEYSIWADRDPHAKAHLALYNERSQQIIRNLPGPQAPPEQNMLCLGCHSGALSPPVAHAFGSGDLRPPLAQPVAHAFGAPEAIGCDRCHGSAEHWLTTHYLPAWRSKTDAEKVAHGMKPTADLGARARLCMECHVGDASNDVHHELIAAGHPRLTFELSAYLAMYPKHWSEAEDRRRWPDFEARAWAVGQLTGARSALHLLEARARSPERTWPEFAEMDCFGCHQNAWPPSRGPTPSREVSPPALPGTPAWNTWHHFALASGKLDPWLLTVDRELHETLKELRQEMEKPVPDRSRTAALAASAGQRIEALSLRPAPRPGPDAALLLDRLEHLLQGSEMGMRWDGSAQVWLALAAHHRALADLAPKAIAPDFGASLRRAREALAFPKPLDSPAGDFADQYHRELTRMREILRR